MQSLMLDVLPWIREGFCCSQLLILLTQELMGTDCSAAVRAARGLCFGLGDGNGPCGLLTGGACALSLLAGSKETTDISRFQPMLQDYALWFEQEAAPKGIRCQDITGAAGVGQVDLMSCGDLLSQCWEKILLLAEEYEIGGV